MKPYSTEQDKTPQVMLAQILLEKLVHVLDTHNSAQ